MTRTLIVDDHPANLYLLRVLLEGHGFAVEEARHGAEALAKARVNLPDLVISDLLMPVLDGYTLLRHWRSDDRLKGIPFVVYTATYTEPRDERLAMALGADAFIIKPAEPDHLMARIREVLEMKEHQTLPSARERPLEEHVLLKEYNEVLVRKLEKKALEAETTNRELRDEIVERRLAEEKLRQSEERFRATFEQAAVGIAHVGADGHFLWANDKLCEMTGYRHDELTRLTFFDLSAPEDRSAGEAARQAMLSGAQTVYTAEKRYRRKDGSLFWVNLVTTLLRDVPGAEPHFVSVFLDITDTKRTEEALRLHDRAIQEVSEGILITDARQPDHPIIYASAGFERITGYRRDETLGRNCRFLQGRDTDPETVAALRDAVANGRPCTMEILNYRKDGQPFWNALSLNPVRDGNGALSHYVGVQRDVTTKRDLEGQLRQSQKMEAVGRLAGGIAHDFNNLLTIIGGYSDLLLVENNIGDGEREVVQSIKDAAERAAALTRQLLGFSRQTMMQPEIVDLNAIVTETGKMLQRLLGEDILLTTTLAPDLHRVKVDPGQMNQILMNLAVNARDAMPDGGRLTIETANVVLSPEYAATHLDCRPGPHVMLAMTDTGCGMTADVRARIFEPFFTTKGIDKGTGLGLSMVFGIVQQSNGCIYVYSEPGQGTTFKIYCPIVVEHRAAAAQPASQSDLRGTETILLVEDEPAVRELTSRILQMQGYQVLHTNDSQQVLPLVESHDGPIHLVLTDVVMPNVSGPELARQLRSRFPDIKVLFMSGYTDDAVVRHGLLEAEVPFIQKPYTPAALAQKVRQVLDRRP